MSKTDQANTDDYGFSFSEEVTETLTSKIQSVFPDTTGYDLKAFAANVLIGHIPAKKVSDSVGETFNLCGFYVKDVRFKKENRNGKYMVLFGHSEKVPRAYATTSDKVYDALTKIIAVYGDAAEWKQGISVKIRMNSTENGGSYSLEVI